jgi:hypothetical protein
VPEKIIVAVHGIGDQVRCETVQAVAYEVYRYYGLAAGLPLGRLHSDLVQLDNAPPVNGVYLVERPPLKGFGFAEVYWADVPRGPAKERYSLEESKKWARTVIERVRSFDDDRRARGLPVRADQNYELAAQVIEEMIEGIRSIERLLFLARMLNVFKFDLGRLLTDYLGDVQIVAEFTTFRRRILAGFQDVMYTIHNRHPQAELHIVAHSEGTVVSFLGILQALRRDPLDKVPGRLPPSPDWVKQLRGFMTIGSPLNKHLFLWPELFQPLAAPPAEDAWKAVTPSLAGATPARIAWRNYYDYGDPIGFRLNHMRRWLGHTGWNRFFEFEGPHTDLEAGRDQAPKHDIGFTRYWFPGKAHTDYWTDLGVFGHFIQTVVRPDPDPANRTFDPPRTRPARAVVSPFIPYLLAAGLLVLGVFLLYRGVAGVTLPFPETTWDSVRNVLAISLVLAGVTAATRIPRVTRSWRWRWSGYAFFAATLLAFPYLLTCWAKARLGSPILYVLGQAPELLQSLDALAAWLPGVRDCSETGMPPGATLVLMGLVLAGLIVVYAISRARPLWGVKPLIVCGVAIIVGVVVVRVTSYRDFLAQRDYLAHTVLDKTRIPDATLEQAAFRLYNLYLASGQKQDFGEFLKTDPPACRLLSCLPKRQTPQGATAEAGAPVHEGTTDRPLWPMLLGGLAFLYLWWVAAVAFDLAVAWQHYVRRSSIIPRLREMDPDLERASRYDEGAANGGRGGETAQRGR